MVWEEVLRPCMRPLPPPTLQSKEKEAVKGGKAPYYLKKSEQKRLELVAKYEELKANGRLEKYMDKRRQKNAKKEHKQLVAPRRQPSAV